MEENCQANDPDFDPDSDSTSESYNMQTNKEF